MIAPSESWSATNVIMPSSPSRLATTASLVGAGAGQRMPSRATTDRQSPVTRRVSQTDDRRVICDTRAARGELRARCCCCSSERALTHRPGGKLKTCRLGPSRRARSSLRRSASARDAAARRPRRRASRPRPMHRSAAQSFGSVRHPLRRIWGDDTDARRRLRRLQAVSAVSANRATPALPSRDLALVDGDGNLLRIGQVSG
jgi:hypothetical protein